MGEVTGIAWTHHTFNAWKGCAKVSPGCKNCYAGARNERFRGGAHWGVDAPRLLRSDSYWREPLKWAKAFERLATMYAAGRMPGDEQEKVSQ